MAALDPVDSRFPDLATVHWVGERVRVRPNPTEQLSLTAGRIWRIVPGVEPFAVRHIVYHSPSGISWGADGVGAADSALSLLIDAGLAPDDAWRLHREFAHDVVAHLPVVEFELPGRTLAHWLASFA